MLDSINSLPEVTDHGIKVRPLCLVVCFSPVRLRYLHVDYRHRVGELTGLVFSQGTTVKQKQKKKTRKQKNNIGGICDIMPACEI